MRSMMTRDKIRTIYICILINLFGIMLRDTKVYRDDLDEIKFYRLCYRD